MIPESMRGDMLLRIHQGHQGLTKCRERYKGAVWWPGIASDVKRLVSSCKHCNIHRPSQNKEPLITTPLPDLPWQKLAADLCELRGRHYLIVIDYFSRWLEILELPKTTSETVIQKLKGIFTRFGIPEQLMTDNDLNSQLNSLDTLQWSTISTMSPQVPISHSPTAWPNEL